MTKDDIQEARKINWGKSAGEIAQIIQAEKPELIPNIKLVGRWLWAYFDAKPSRDIRELLSSLGFRWNKRRGCWQHCGGHPSKNSPRDPRFKYGEESLQSAINNPGLL